MTAVGPWRDKRIDPSAATGPGFIRLGLISVFAVIALVPIGVVVINSVLPPGALVSGGITLDARLHVGGLTATCSTRHGAAVLQEQHDRRRLEPP